MISSKTRELTRAQKEAVFAAGITPVDNWFLVEETDFYLKIEHRLTHTRRRVDKFVTKIIPHTDRKSKWG